MADTTKTTKTTKMVNTTKMTKKTKMFCTFSGFDKMFPETKLIHIYFKHSDAVDKNILCRAKHHAIEVYNEYNKPILVKVDEIVNPDNSDFCIARSVFGYYNGTKFTYMIYENKSITLSNADAFIDMVTDAYPDIDPDVFTRIDRDLLSKMDKCVIKTVMCILYITMVLILIYNMWIYWDFYPSNPTPLDMFEWCKLVLFEEENIFNLYIILVLHTTLLFMCYNYEDLVKRPNSIKNTFTLIELEHLHNSET